MMRENARTTREIIPAEAWEHFNNLYLNIKDAASRGLGRRARQQLLETVMGDCQRVFGLLTGSMNHDTAYAFIQIGRKIERADMTSRMVDVKYFMLLPSTEQVGTQFDNVQWSALLKSASALEMYRKKWRQINHINVVEFLIPWRI